jgi:hypothetical protein
LKLGKVTYSFRNHIYSIVAGGTPWKVRVLEKVWIELLIKFIYIRLIGSEYPHFWKYAQLLKICIRLKGRCHKIFCFWFFHEAPDIPF